MAKRRYNPQTQQVPSQFGTLSYNTGIVQEYGLPVEAIARTSAKLDQIYKQQEQFASQLQTVAKMDKMKVRDVDNHIIDEQVKKVDNEIQSIGKSQDWHRAGNQLNSLYQEYQTNMPRLAAIKARSDKAAFSKELEENEIDSHIFSISIKFVNSEQNF